MLIVIHHLLTPMSNPLRFTPLYVIRMFLDIKYGANSNIFLPEAFLEYTPKFEEDLRQNLKNIDTIAESGDSKLIIEYMTEQYYLTKNRHEYYYMVDDLFDIPDNDYNCANLESFLSHVEIPNIINCDFVRDLIPVNVDILYGNYCVLDVFDPCISLVLLIDSKAGDLRVGRPQDQFLTSRFDVAYAPQCDHLPGRSREDEDEVLVRKPHLPAFLATGD